MNAVREWISGRFPGAALVAVATVVATCGADAPPTLPTASSENDRPLVSQAPTSAQPTTTARPTPGKTTIAVDDLPIVELAGINATAICDPMASQRNIDAGDRTVYCSDGLALAAAAARAATPDEIVRMYLRRPVCAAVPCSDDELSRADVIVWTEREALLVQLDSRLESVGYQPVPAGAGWPEAGSSTAPDIRRPELKGAPRAVETRTPYPFCGRAEIGDPPEVFGCFRDAVLDGRPAEMIERVYGTEGGAIVRIFRYDGDGRVVSFTHDTSDDGRGQFVDTWRRDEGAIVLGITPLEWDLSPWDGAGRSY